MFKVGKRYLKVQGIQRVPSGPGLWGGEADRQTHQYHHSAWPGSIGIQKFEVVLLFPILATFWTLNGGMGVDHVTKVLRHFLA